MSDSAAHWCKSVVEEVVPTVTKIPPPPPPPKFKFAGSTIPQRPVPPQPVAPPAPPAQSSATGSQYSLAGQNAAATSYHAQYYQQYYGQYNPAAQQAYMTQQQQSAQAAYAYSSYPVGYSGQTAYGGAYYMQPPVQSNSALPSAATPGSATTNATNATSATTSTSSTSGQPQAPYQPPPPQSAHPSDPPVKKPNKSRFQPQPAASAQNSTSQNLQNAAAVAAGGSTSTGAPASGSTGVTSSAAPVAPPSAAWPPKLMQYVTKCFALCDNADERTYMSGILQKMITKVAGEGRLLIHRWELEPVPDFGPLRPTQTQSQAPASSNGSSHSSSSTNTGGKNNSNPRAGYDSGRYSHAAGSGGDGSRWGEGDYGRGAGGGRDGPAGPDEDGGKKKRKSRWEESPPRGGGRSGSPSYGLHGSSSGGGSGSYNSSYGSRGSYDTSTSSTPLTVEGGKKGKGGGGGGSGIYSEEEASNRQRDEAEMLLLQRRANRFKAVEESEPSSSSSSGRGAFNNKWSAYAGSSSSSLLLGAGVKDKKKKRNGFALGGGATGAYDAGADFNMDALKVVGTSQRLEKDYFRLTSAPDPSTVRPEPVLREAMVALKAKWRDDSVDYVYMCSQLKALRQDLTVQHIQNDFTVDVYETHARVALESEDLNEYNQCQTQLKQLYASGLRGSEAEFVAYRILYYVYLLGNQKYKGGGTDLSDVMVSLCSRPDISSNVAIVHALDVRQAVQQNNYHRFFRLYASAPNMGAYILDLMLDTWRWYALQRMVRAYKPTINAAFVIEELAFPSPAAGLDFLRRAGCALVDPAAASGKASSSAFADAEPLWEISVKDTVLDSSAVFTQDKLLL